MTEAGLSSLSRAPCGGYPPSFQKRTIHIRKWVFNFLKIKVIKRICSYNLAQKQRSPFHVFPYFSACNVSPEEGIPYSTLLSYDVVEQKGKASEKYILFFFFFKVPGHWQSCEFHSTVVADFIPAAALIVITSRNSMKHSSEGMYHPSKGNQVAQWDTTFRDA